MPTPPYRYIFVHEQAFQVAGIEEDSRHDDTALADRHTTILRTALDEVDMVNGVTPQWICDMDLPDMPGPNGEPCISTKLPL